MTGCDPADIDGTVDISEIGDIHERGLEHNGFQLNGYQLNGFQLNSFRLNGDWLGASDNDGIQLTEAYVLNGPAIAEGWLEGSNLHVYTELGEELSGAQLVGAQLVFDVLEDGELVQGRHAKVVGAKQMYGKPDVWLYSFAVQGDDDAWHPLCVDKNNAPTEAILLQDVWDMASGDRISPRPSGAVTLACRGAALAKCVEWGYAPWSSYNGVSLADYHQACTRAVRADYCGDGTPHTVNGVEIHVKDALGIQKEDNSVPHVVEAEWGPNGALCLNYGNTRLPNQNVGCALPACDASFAAQSLLQTGKLVKP